MLGGNYEGEENIEGSQDERLRGETDRTRKSEIVNRDTIADLVTYNLLEK